MQPCWPFFALPRSDIGRTKAQPEYVGNAAVGQQGGTGVVHGCSVLHRELGADLLAGRVLRGYDDIKPYVRGYIAGLGFKQ